MVTSSLPTSCFWSCSSSVWFHSIAVLLAGLLTGRVLSQAQRTIRCACSICMCDRVSFSTILMCLVWDLKLRGVWMSWELKISLISILPYNKIIQLNSCAKGRFLWMLAWNVPWIGVNYWFWTRIGVGEGVGLVKYWLVPLAQKLMCIYVCLLDYNFCSKIWRMLKKPTIE